MKLKKTLRDFDFIIYVSIFVFPILLAYFLLFAYILNSWDTFLTMAIILLVIVVAYTIHD